MPRRINDEPLQTENYTARKYFYKSGLVLDVFGENSVPLGPKTSYILDGRQYDIIKIGISHWIPISIALSLAIYNVTPLSN